MWIEVWLLHLNFLRSVIVFTEEDPAILTRFIALEGLLDLPVSRVEYEKLKLRFR